MLLISYITVDYFGIEERTLITYTMPNIERLYSNRKGQHLLIRGGYEVNVPDLIVEQSFGEAWRQSFMQDGMSYYAAKIKVDRLSRTFSIRAYVPGLKSSIFRWAELYSSRYPGDIDCSRSPHELWGFDPARASTFYVPEQNLGRGGLSYVDGELMRMHEKVT